MTGVLPFQALCSLLRRDASINFKAKGNSLVSVLACNLLMAAYEEDENWPEIFVKVRNSQTLSSLMYFSHVGTLCQYKMCFQVYIEDSLGERIWVDSSHCKNFVDNIQTAFGTKMPPKSMLLQADTGRTGGDLSAGSYTEKTHRLVGVRVAAAGKQMLIGWYCIF